MKRGPYNKPGRDLVKKYCPCENEAMKDKGVYVKDHGSYICEDCKRRESRFHSSEWEIRRTDGEREYIQNDLQHEENALT